MELLQAIALLCQVNAGDPFYSYAKRDYLECQQYYIHCINTKTGLVSEKLERCILERKL